VVLGLVGCTCAGVWGCVISSGLTIAIWEKASALSPIESRHLTDILNRPGLVNVYVMLVPFMLLPSMLHSHVYGGVPPSIEADRSAVYGALPIRGPLMLTENVFGYGCP